MAHAKRNPFLFYQVYIKILKPMKGWIMFACCFSLCSFLAGPLAGIVGFPGKPRHHQAASTTPGTYIFVQCSVFLFQLSKVMETSPDGFQCPVCYHKVCIWGWTQARILLEMNWFRMNACISLSHTDSGIPHLEGMVAYFHKERHCSECQECFQPLSPAPFSTAWCHWHCLPRSAEPYAEGWRTLSNFCLWSQK